MTAGDAEEVAALACDLHLAGSKCYDLFQALRVEIKRVAPNQQRRRMPARAYKLYDAILRMQWSVDRLRKLTARFDEQIGPTNIIHMRAWLASHGREG